VHRWGVTAASRRAPQPAEEIFLVAGLDEGYRRKGNALVG
jgi:hypothetical protein